MANILWTIETIAAVLLTILVLLHSPKGDGIGGIGGASHVFASQKSAEKGLNKLTGIICGNVYFLYQKCIKILPYKQPGSKGLYIFGL